MLAAAGCTSNDAETGKTEATAVPTGVAFDGADYENQAAKTAHGEQLVSEPLAELGGEQPEQGLEHALDHARRGRLPVVVRRAARTRSDIRSTSAASTCRPSAVGR